MPQARHCNGPCLILIGKAMTEDTAGQQTPRTWNGPSLAGLTTLAKRHQTALVATAFAFLTFSVYWYLGPQDTVYINHVYQADAFLHGRLDLGQDYPWLEVAYKDGKVYEVHPPMPAIIILPGVALFGQALNQTLVSAVIGALCAPLVFGIVRKFTEKLSAQVWLTVLYLFGTIFWYSASHGGVWFFTHTVGVFFLLLAVYATLVTKSPLLAGLFLGAAFWSRQPMILALPFFLIMFSDQWLSGSLEKPLLKRIDIVPMIKLGLGVGLFVALALEYNNLRFGSPFDYGSDYSKQATDQPALYNHGPFDISYIPRHIPAVFELTPVFQSNAPYIIPSFLGMALWATTPAFFYSLFANLRDWRVVLVGGTLMFVALYVIVSRNVSAGLGWEWVRLGVPQDLPHDLNLVPFFAMISLAIAAGLRYRDKLVIACWSAIIPVALLLFSFAATGWAQFGYRYGLDFYPFLFLLTIRGIGEEVKWHHKLLIVVSVAINLWGVLWIYQFDPRQFLDLRWVTI